MVRAIDCYVLAAQKIHGDDAPVPVRMTARPAPPDPPAVLFRYSSDRKRPRSHLATFTGVLQADAYARFDQLYGDKIQEAACWAHVRRKL